MDVARSSEEDNNIKVSLWGMFMALMEKLRGEIEKIGKKLLSGYDDRRRIIHSMKVGTAITIASLMYYVEPIYDHFGDSSLWAIISVVVVFEFYVGATLGRGFNRGLGTLVAGSLGFCAHHVVHNARKMRPVLLAILVFLFAMGATFSRFFPRIKARYDYGILIFILTFCLISISGYHDDGILKIARDRVSTIMIGGLTAIGICIFICPAWAGDDLHNLIALNVDKLGHFLLEGFGNECLQSERKDRSSFVCETVTNSKLREDSLANFAAWEPPHGRFKLHHPWKQYRLIAIVTRECAYKVGVLGSYQLNLPSHVPQSRIHSEIREGCLELSSELGKALRELGSIIKTMSHKETANNHIARSKIVSKNLESLLKLGIGNDDRILEIVPAASLLIDIVSDTIKIAESIQKLASLAKFKILEQKPDSRKIVPTDVVIEIDSEISQSLPCNK